MSNKSTIKNFFDLDAWKKGHELVLDIYRITRNFPREEIYSMVNQLRRAVTSITANISEGFARYHYKDKIRFYYQARGTNAEVQNFLLVAKDLEYINKKECDHLVEKADEVRKLINGLIRSIEDQYKL